MKVKGVMKALLWPYVALIVTLRLVSMGRTPLLSALPARVIREVPEIPFVIYVSLMLCSLVLSRHAIPFPEADFWIYIDNFFDMILWWYILMIGLSQSSTASLLNDSWYVSGLCLNHRIKDTIIVCAKGHSLLC